MTPVEQRFVLGLDWESEGIALFSAGHFSHCDAVVPPGGVPGTTWKPGDLVGARSDKVGGKPPGLQCRPFGYEPVKLAVRFYLPMSDEQATAFWAFMVSQEGKGYDKAGIAGFALGDDLHTPGTYFCSAGLLDAEQSADWVPPLYSTFNKIPPVALANLNTALGATWAAEKET